MLATGKVVAPGVKYLGGRSYGLPNSYIIALAALQLRCRYYVFFLSYIYTGSKAYKCQVLSLVLVIKLSYYKTYSKYKLWI